MEQLQNPIRSYAWGSTTAIPELLGVPADGRPQAEMWLGAHPDSPSRVGPSARRLDVELAGNPVAMLGQRVTDRFGPRLPYLMKVLAADAPLSLQVHPSQAQAELGFSLENIRGVPQSAADRRYRDAHHKPEMLLALTPFEALCGLKEPVEALELLKGLRVEHRDWQELLKVLSTPETGLHSAFKFLLGRDNDIPGLVNAVATACAQRIAANAAPLREDNLVLQLFEAYPGDPGVILSLLLNHVGLEPFQAVYLPAGNVHSYIRGAGIEIMAASDNVLRAGLTPKHVDPEEVLNVVNFEPAPVPIVAPIVCGAVRCYRPGAAEFELALIELHAERASLTGDGPRIILVLDGEIVARAESQQHSLGKGASMFVPDSDGTVELSGAGSIVVAGVPRA